MNPTKSHTQRACIKMRNNEPMTSMEKSLVALKATPVVTESGKLCVSVAFNDGEPLVKDYVVITSLGSVNLYLRVGSVRVDWDKGVTICSVYQD